ncbi:MAG: hypothetical protein ABFR33_12120 [Verrucomicrobiota bacterium]
MKRFAGVLFVSVLVVVLAGCANNVAYVPKIPPHAKAKLLDYFEQPDNKVFIIAVDPGGSYAFGYDYGKPTLKDAAKVAVEKCDASREASGIIARPYIYALNDKVVYEEMILKAHEGSVEKEREVQKEELEKEDSEINPEAVEASEGEKTATE